jgi:TPR repeat protein
MSPEQPAWDNPFPTFPGGKKKTSISEEQKIVQQMAAMEVGAPPPQNRPRTAGSKGSQDPYGGRGPTDDYGRPSLDSQRSLPSRDYPPRGPSRGPLQQGYPDQRRGPPPAGPGYSGLPRQNGYNDSGYNDRGAYSEAAPISPMRENFGPPARSMTMPNEPPMMPGGRQPPVQMGGARPDERPYNGPIGRGMPPRPSTATGTRPPPQQYPASDSYMNNNKPPNKPYHQPEPSISDFYDSYYEAPAPPPPRPGRSQSNESEMPNFDAVPFKPAAHRRGASIDDHIQAGPGAPKGNSFEQQQNGYQPVKPMKSQPDIRARAQPEAAVFEMASEAPPLPSTYPPQGYPDDGYAPQNGQYNGQQPQRGPLPAQSYGEFNPPPAQNGFPPRAASAAPRTNGLPSGPKAGFNGFPGGPSPNGAASSGPPRQTPPANADALPSHPPPVRAGLIPNSIASQANNKPPPVRNYNNVSPAQQSAPSQQQQQTAAQQAPARSPPVTVQELEQLRNTTSTNPNDQATAMILARKLVEASEVLVPAIPDQRSRNKTREKYIMDAHKILKKLVAAQNTEAMFYLADCYGRGALGLETDNKEAFSLYQSAAKAGHAAAAYRTAVCCELGNEEGGGTRKDPLKAIQWYKRAAMLGDTPAMYKMGMIQLKGLLGQPKNPREAVGWLKRAAERADAENPHALHELGLLYEQPQGADGSIVRDEAYAFSLFQKAADLGYKFSQFRMGCAYEYGLFNCPIDPRQSIMWYSRAAVQEEHQSELALSGWYLTGSEGVLQQSDTEAYLWARKAAMAGLAKAEYAMGYFTEVGIGSPASLEDAKRWYWRAAGMFSFSPSALPWRVESVLLT